MEAKQDSPQSLNPEAPASAWRGVAEEKARDLYQRARGPQADEERWVHEVRVATRRFQEALALAKPVLPPIDKAKRRAQKLRRALGEARELDVLMADLLSLETLRGWDPTALQAKLNAHRDGLMERAQNEVIPKVGRHEKKAVALTRGGPEIPFLARDVAAAHLHGRCVRVDERLPCLQSPEAASEHHRLRVDIKRLRYTLEMLQPLVELDPRPLKMHQDKLGRLNDSWDLLTFAGGRLVRRSLGDQHEAVEAEIRQRIAERYEEAQEAATSDLPERLGALRREAGHLGKLELRR